MELAVLLDAPQLTSADRSLHPVARLGRYSDPRYGKFAITRADVASWQRNLSGIQGGRVAIDYDHAAEQVAGSTKAAGWITGVRLMTGAQLAEAAPTYQDTVEPSTEYAVATIDWTPEGAQSVRDGYWLYVSPTFSSSYQDEDGTDHGPTLIGTALTNRPFLRRGMPAISLSRAPLADLPAATPDEPTGRRDSPAMPDLQKIAEALKLSGDATEEQILAAIADREPVSLTAAAEAEGKVLLSRDEHDDLTARAQRTEGKVLLSVEQHAELTDQASKGAQAHEQLAKLTFERAYDKALSDGRLPSDEDTRAKWLGRYTGDWGEKVTLEALAELPRRVNTSPTGDAGAGEEDVPAGVDPDRAALHSRALAIQAEKNVTYLEAATQAEKELSRAA